MPILRKQKRSFIHKNMYKYIDTNIIIRFLQGDGNNPNDFEYAKKIFQEIEDNKISVILEDFICAECIYVLEKIYKIEKETVTDILVDIIDNSNIHSSKYLNEALELYSIVSLDFADCLLITKAKNRNSEVISLDKKLQKTLQKLQ